MTFREGQGWYEVSRILSLDPVTLPTLNYPHAEKSWKVQAEFYVSMSTLTDMIKCLSKSCKQAGHYVRYDDISAKTKIEMLENTQWQVFLLLMNPPLEHFHVFSFFLNHQASIMHLPQLM